MSSTYPYAERFPVNSTMPPTGRDRGEIIAELRELAGAEDGSSGIDFVDIAQRDGPEQLTRVGIDPKSVRGRAIGDQAATIVLK